MEFARRIVQLYNYLTREKHEFIMSKQVLRSSTSTGANIAEAIYASSRKDFVAKLQIARKEAAETLYWLELLHSCDYFSGKLYDSINFDCRELLLMLTSSMKTTVES